MDLKSMTFVHVPYLGLLFTVLSIVLTTVWCLYSRGKDEYGDPVAIYRVQIHFSTQKWKRYYIHCHGRICKALANGLSIAQSNLIILDQCSESYKSMKIEARILKTSDADKMKTVSQEWAQNVLNELKLYFEDDLMELNVFYAEHVNYGQGEYVYNQNTRVLVLCNAIKSCRGSKQKRAVHDKTDSNPNAVQCSEDDGNDIDIDNNNNDNELFQENHTQEIEKTVESDKEESDIRLNESLINEDENELNEAAVEMGRSRFEVANDSVINDGGHETPSEVDPVATDNVDDI